MTKPAKKALIHDMISVCGIIIAMFPFIIDIMFSIPAGSVIGFGAGWPFSDGSARYAPLLRSPVTVVRRERKEEEGSTAYCAERRLVCRRERCSRWRRKPRGLGVLAKRMVA